MVAMLTAPPATTAEASLPVPVAAADNVSGAGLGAAFVILQLLMLRLGFRLPLKSKGF